MSVNGIGAGYPVWRDMGKAQRNGSGTGFAGRMADADAAGSSSPIRSSMRAAGQTSVMEAYRASAASGVRNVKPAYETYESENYRIVPDNEAGCFDIYNKQGEEIRVNTLEDINEIIADYNSYYDLPRPGISAIDDPTVYLQTFFRGQSDESWKIRASIEGAKEQENEILANFSSMYDGNAFDLIAYVQHYRTGTRFIDFTTDKDVALYFACSENMDKDGALFMWCYSPHKAEWYTASVLAEVAQINSDFKMSVQELSEMILRKSPTVKDAFKETIELNTAIVSFLDHGFMAVPPESAKDNNLSCNDCN